MTTDELVAKYRKKIMELLYAPEETDYSLDDCLREIIQESLIDHLESLKTYYPNLVPRPRVTKYWVEQEAKYIAESVETDRVFMITNILISILEQAHVAVEEPK